MIALTDINLAGANWRKARASQTNGNCVEVADLGAQIAVRDSKNPHGPVLAFSSRGWAGFLGGTGTTESTQS